MNVILATDAGSTTIKARLFMKMENEWRFVIAGEVPTTVESPFEDDERRCRQGRGVQGGGGRRR
jgi:hypothetical protein